MADRTGKTEEPTQRRLEKARKEGQFPQAKEFIAALQFLILLGLMGAGGAGWLAEMRQTTRAMFTLAFRADFGPTDLSHLVWTVCRRLIAPLVLAGLALAAATLSFRLATTRFGLSFKKLVPDAERFNPLAKLRDLPKQNLPQAVQALLVLPLFLYA